MSSLPGLRSLRGWGEEEESYLERRGVREENSLERRGVEEESRWRKNRLKGRGGAGGEWVERENGGRE